MNVDQYPFDVQNCTWTLQPDAYNANEMRMTSTGTDSFYTPSVGECHPINRHISQSGIL